MKAHGRHFSVGSKRPELRPHVFGTDGRAMTILALAAQVKCRDRYTGAHLEHVQRYSRVLTQYLQQQEDSPVELDQAYIDLFGETSLLHDIGKVGICDDILLKADDLTKAEFEIMKTHTLRGAETIDVLLERFPDADFLNMARDIVLYHHEWYDGNGYPAGLAGHEIPLCARILAVADVYDALTCKRVYKPADSHDSAKSEILNEKGTHFDPMVVEAFLAAEDDFNWIREEYAEGEAPSRRRQHASTERETEFDVRERH